MLDWQKGKDSDKIVVTAYSKHMAINVHIITKRLNYISKLIRNIRMETRINFNSVKLEESGEA